MLYKISVVGIPHIEPVNSKKLSFGTEEKFAIGGLKKWHVSFCSVKISNFCKLRTLLPLQYIRNLSKYSLLNWNSSKRRQNLHFRRCGINGKEQNNENHLSMFNFFHYKFGRRSFLFLFFSEEITSFENLRMFEDLRLETYKFQKFVDLLFTLWTSERFAGARLWIIISREKPIDYYVSLSKTIHTRGGISGTRVKTIGLYCST